MNFRAHLIIIGLPFLTLEINALTTQSICTTKPCQNTALRINQYIDPDVDPCENFYEFACGTFLKNANGDIDLEFETQLRKTYQREIADLYREELEEYDHKVVKMARKLYNGCLNESQIEEDSLETLRKVFEQVGGWPVLEGSQWNEENFNWVNVTCKLRELGYHSPGLVNLHSVYNYVEHRYTFMLTFEDYLPDDLEFMTEMVMKFELENREDVVKEMKGANELSKALMQIWTDSDFESEVLTIEQLQKKVPIIDWLNYINHIVAPVVQLTNTDEILFMHFVQSIAEFISTTSKKDVANLMMWQVMKSVIPYFTETTANEHQSREEFCMKMAEKMFIPNPMEVIYSRKYLSVEKKNKIEEMTTSMKKIGIEMIKNAEWLTEAGKIKILEKLKTLRIHIGLPGYYSDDKIFDCAEADLVDVENGTFFDLLATVQRNSKALKYRLVKKTDDNILTFYNRFANTKGYHYSDNLIYIPVYLTRNMVYDENIPEYINYGIMGMMFGMFASDVLCVECLDRYGSEKAQELLNNKLGCVQQSQMSSTLATLQRNKVLKANFAQQLAYDAYRKFVKTNGAEQKLMSLDYTPNQLFWISTAFGQCHLNDPNDSWHVNYEKDANKTSVVQVNNPKSWNRKFLQDFKCSETSKMHAADDCKVFYMPY